MNHWHANSCLTVAFTLRRQVTNVLSVFCQPCHVFTLCRHVTTVSPHATMSWWGDGAVMWWYGGGVKMESWLQRSGVPVGPSSYRGPEFPWKAILPRMWIKGKLIWIHDLSDLSYSVVNAVKKKKKSSPEVGATCRAMCQATLSRVARGVLFGSLGIKSASYARGPALDSWHGKIHLAIFLNTLSIK